MAEPLAGAAAAATDESSDDPETCTMFAAGAGVVDADAAARSSLPSDAEAAMGVVMLGATNPTEPTVVEEAGAAVGTTTCLTTDAVAVWVRSCVATWSCSWCDTAEWTRLVACDSAFVLCAGRPGAGLELAGDSVARRCLSPGCSLKT